MSILSFNRKFELWAYHVSHQQLLLRSNKRHENDTRIEVLFRGVRRVCLPVWMPILTIFDSTPPRGVDNAWERKEFVVDYGESTGVVEAAAVFHDISDLDFMAESKLLQRTIL